MIDKVKIIKEFNRIKDLGFIKSNRSHNTGIGKTFEDHLGVIENNDRLPDFAGFEVKSQRALTSSFLTLFTKRPTEPKGVNNYLRDTFGETYEDNPLLKKLHTSIFSNKFNTYKSTTAFKIINDVESKVVRLVIKNILTDKIVNESIYWTYDELEKALTGKLNALFYVTAESKRIENDEYFHYTSAIIYLNPTLENLLKLIDDGKLMIDIRIGSYKSGKLFGKTHDHGTAFRIRPIDLRILYTEIIKIE